jgi:hypothetical protein
MSNHTSVNNTNTLGKTLTITYSYDTKEFSLFDCLDNLIRTDTDGRKLSKYAWSLSPQAVKSLFDLALVEN